MPAGDAQRVWFPEMIEELERSWARTMSWDKFADLCARMTEMRIRIRRERAIQPPRMRCKECGGVLLPRADVSGISIRSALFALKNGGIITGTEFEKLDRSWMEHRKKNGLDAFGRRAETCK